MLLLRALSARSYTRIIIAWKVSKLHGYRAENAMKHPMMPTCSRGDVQDWKARAFLALQSQLLGGANLAAEAITFTIPRSKENAPARGRGVPERAARRRQ
jgi:hypothetical protein